MAERRDCTRCKGTGISHHDGFTALDGTVYPSRDNVCPWCNGAKTFEPVDVRAIIEAIHNPRTKRIRTSRPTTGGNRAYYVWRLARFHGGVDVCLPVMAESLIEGDPFADELGMIAEKVAAFAFGTSFGAVRAWSPVLRGAA